MKYSVEQESQHGESIRVQYPTEYDQLDRQIKVLYDLLGKALGEEQLGRTIEKLGLAELVDSSQIEKRIEALEKLVFKQKSVEPIRPGQIQLALEKIENGISDILARQMVEARLENQVIEKMEKNQAQYMEEIKLQILNKRLGSENANTLKKYAVLEKLETRGLSRSAMEMLRPTSLDEIVGQERAVKALITKLASPYPQHVLIYGPPGVGKTTAARLVLEMAKKMSYTPFDAEAKFVEVDGTTLRWDPREITNPLLGSVHDPIYQGTKRDLAETGIPEPKTGLVTEAHGGVLFIDEIGELDLFLQNKLLKVLEDKRVYFDSSYYDPDDENTPKYVKKLFDEGAPADFILIGATTRHPSEINPALRSRCAEVFFEPLDPGAIEKIVRNAAKRIGVTLEEGVADTISQYTAEGRKAVNLLTDAYSMALFRQGGLKGDRVVITCEDLHEVLQVSRLSPILRHRAGSGAEVGHIFGLGVSGFLGSVIEFEAVAFPAREKGKGTIRFNDTAGSMARDSVFNAGSVIRSLTGEEISEYDIHVNAVGGGNIDGPSAGAAILLVILSAIKGKPLRQDVAVTGEISIQGRIKPVGGVYEKIYGARMAGMKKVLIPRENEKDVPFSLEDMEIIPIGHIKEALDLIFTG